MLLTDPHPLPRTAWGETWRILAALGFGLALFGIVVVASADIDSTPAVWVTVVDLALGALSLLLLPLRRRFPLPIALVLALFGFLSASSSGAASIALISLCTHRRWAPVAVVAVPSMVASLTYEQVRPTEATGGLWMVVTNVVIGVLALAVCVAIGYYIGARRALFASWRDRAETAEREQASRVAQARANERARIAREMHDVLAHRISLVAMHSGALAYRKDLTADEVAEAAAIVRDNSHLALTELRDVLGVLRSVDDLRDGLDGAPEQPQPTLADLDELFAETRSAGVQLTATVEVDDLSETPESLSRNGYRMVQEALTNVRKHAQGCPVELRMTGRRGDGITIESRNGTPVASQVARRDVARGADEPPAIPTSGMGLTGLTERAALSGGTLTFGPDRRGDFVMRAWLPWTP